MTPCSSACRINSWSGRLYDRQASQQVAVHNDADTNAGRYNKRLLQAFAALAATMSNARTSHTANTLHLGRPGRPPAHRPTSAIPPRWTHWSSAWCASAPASSRTTTITSTRPASTSAACSAWRTIPAHEALQGKFAIRYRIVPVPDARHFMADLAEGETERVRRDIEQQVRGRLNARSTISTAASARRSSVSANACARTRTASRWCSATA